MTAFYQRVLEAKKACPVNAYFVTSLDHCERLWKTFTTPKCVSDLWEFRLCFHKHFHHKPCFLVMEDHKGIAGMIPLSYNEETDSFCLFPGETWNSRTWLERTPVYTRNDKYIYDLLRACPENSCLRYLEAPNGRIVPELSMDETGYVLYPGDLDFDIAQYYSRFSRKKMKAIHKVIQSYCGAGSEIHYNRDQDFDRLVEMSLRQFGHKSFMYDIRFQHSFRDVLHFLKSKDMLHMISCEIDDTLAAVDIGAVFQNTYTVFLGGTNGDFPGIAKLMNMNHIEYAFMEKFDKLDFLCGDFHWKLLWHLDPEYLYKYEPSSLIWEQATDAQYTPARMLSFS